MFEHYVLLTWRNAKRNKFFSFINLFGLSMGIAVSIMLFVYIQHELSYDRFHTHAEDIYRVGLYGKLGASEFRQTYSTPQLAGELSETFSQVKYACRIATLGSFFVKMKEEGKTASTFQQPNVYAADATFFDVFSFPLTLGSKDKVLREPGKLLLTESMAAKYFGTNWSQETVIGQSLIFKDEEGEEVYEVEGVLADFPEASHFHADFIISTTNLPYLHESNWWNNYALSTYIQLDPAADPAQVEAAMAQVFRKHMGEEQFDQWLAEGNRWEGFLQPLTAIHLKSQLNGEFEPNGNITYIYIFSSAGLLVLLLALVNFINLTTAKASTRAKEIGIKQAVGSGRKQLIVQHLGETFIFCLLAVLLALLLLEIAHPALKTLIGVSLHISYTTNPFIIPSLLLFTALLSLLAGLYPAFYLTAFQPVQVLSGKKQNRKNNVSLRHGLTVFQFAICAIMIIGTLVIHEQITFLQNQNLGFNKEQVLVIRNTSLISKDTDLFLETVKKRSQVLQASASMSIPGTDFGNVQFLPEGYAENLALSFSWVDEHFADTYQIRMLEGRFFSPGYASDSLSVVINQQAVDEFGWEEPIGKKIYLYGKGGTAYTVVGVTENVHYASMHQSMQPVLLLPEFSPQSWGHQLISVRIDSKQMPETLAYLEAQWSQFAADVPFDYFFFDNHYDQLYRNEELTAKIISLFAVLIVFVALLGLIGLVTYQMDLRTKEIGIRKVLGASVASMMMLLSKDYLKLICIAFIIAIPVANYLAYEWLHHFAYQVNLQWWWFVLPGMLIITVAALSVTTHTFKTAKRNPVDSLRYE